MSVKGKVRKLHNKLVLICALQMIIWMFSGLYMVVFNIDFIRGDHLIKQKALVTPTIIFDRVNIDFSDISEQFPNAKNIELTSRLNNHSSPHNTPQLNSNLTAVTDNPMLSAGIDFVPAYKMTIDTKTVMVSAQTGSILAWLDQNQAKQLGRFYYQGNAGIINSELIVAEPPQELGARPLPVWRVEFNDQYNSDLYISAISGQLLTKRHTYWRIFDVMWRGHIMDYDDGKNVANWLLFFFSVNALLTVFTGCCLVFFQFRTKTQIWFAGKTS